MLSRCISRTYQPKDNVCTSNTPSDELYILLSGALAIVTAEGLQVATMEPVTTVGEMGVITGQPRSATVEVVERSHLLVIQKSYFDHMLRNDLAMQAKVYRNIVDLLSTKLIHDNIRMRDYQVENRRYEGHITVL